MGLISCLFQAANAEQVSLTEAIRRVQLEFSGKDVDIYRYQPELTSIYWDFFVDAEPMKGWEHECYTYRVMKNPPSPTSEKAVTKTQLKMPPKGNMVPVSVKNRYGAKSTEKPHVKWGPNTLKQNSIASRTYAIILNGASHKNANYERYWNDCSFVYQTLTKKYRISKNHVYVAMSDGTSSDDDMLGLDGTYKSSPTDLDFDGVSENVYAATSENIATIMNELHNKLNKNDHLFVFVVGPCTGGGISIDTASLYLWGGDELNISDLSSYLSAFTSKMVNVNVVLGMKSAGVCSIKLRSANCVVAAASYGTQTPHSCKDIPFDEFVYNWTCAVNEATHDYTAVNSDADQNGRVTMLEAFSYANEKNTFSNDHEMPRLLTKVKSVPEDLAFSFIPETVDLYIKDNPDDTGKVRNLTSDVFWYSPDMWVRNKHDWGTEHQNPECVDFGSSCVVYTRVRNRGRETYTGGKWLHLYWSKASTAITNQAWVGNELYNNTIVTGEHLRPAAIPGPIPPGCDTIVPISWALPLDMVGTEDDNWTEKHHFCLLGKIEDSNTAIMDIKDVRTVDITGQNDVAQLNVSIISHKEAMAGTAVFVRNVMKGEKEYSLEVRPKVAADAAIFTDANVDLWLSRKIYSGWSKGGLRSNNVRTYHSGDSARVRLLSKESRLESVFMNDSEFDKVTMKLNFVNIPVTQKTYTFDLIQRDGDGNIVGGETFIVKSPEVSANSMQIETESTGNGNYELTAEISGGDYEKIWYDADGLEIGRGDNITVKPTREANEYSVTALSANGEMARESVTLTPELGIKTITPAASVGDNLGVTLYNEAPANSTVCVSSVNTGTTMVTESVGTGETTVEVDTSSLPTGLYVVTYTEDGNIVDSKRFDKK